MEEAKSLLQGHPHQGWDAACNMRFQIQNEQVLHVGSIFDIFIIHPLSTINDPKNIITRTCMPAIIEL